MMILTVLYFIVTSYPTPRHFSQLNITEVLQSSGNGLDFSGHYIIGRGDKTPTKRSEDYYTIKTIQSLGAQCSKPVNIEPFTPEKVVQNQMFFIETSGRSKLTPRQACSVESAAKFSNLHVQVILLSDTLDLTDNSTCYLYTSVSNISFHKIDLEKIYENTPLQGLVKSKKFSKSKFQELIKVMH